MIIIIIFIVVTKSELREHDPNFVAKGWEFIYLIW